MFETYIKLTPIPPMDKSMGFLGEKECERYKKVQRHHKRGRVHSDAKKERSQNNSLSFTNVSTPM